MNVKECKVRLVWDEGMWHSETDDKDLGLVLESGSLDALVERVKFAVPEMLELNCGYKGDVRIIFDASRIVDVKMNG